MDKRPPASRWYHQPVVWLGIVVLATVIAGCVHMIVLATRHADPPVETGSEVLFRMPRGDTPAPAPPAEGDEP